MKRRRRRSRRRETNRKSSSPSQAGGLDRIRSPALEPLEPRYLLSADGGSSTASATTDLGLDLVLRVDNHAQQLQLVDVADNFRVLQAEDLTSDTPFQITGTAAADKLVIEFLTPFTYLGGIRFDAGGGRDEVLLSTNGLDELVLTDGPSSSAAFSAQFGANHLSTTGVELFEEQGAIQTAQFVGTEQADAWTVSPQNQQLKVQGLGGFATTMLLQLPETQFSLNGQGGNDYISIFDVQLNLVDLIVEGGAGDDTIELTAIDAERSDFFISGDAGNDTLLVDQNLLSRTNVSLLGSSGDDTLLVVGSQFDRSDLMVDGGVGDDHVTLNSNLLDRSDLVTQGGPDKVAADTAADFDLDGDVDTNDLAEWENDYGQNDGADANGDGQSSGLDFLIWQRQIGNGADHDVIGVTHLQLKESTAQVWGGRSEDSISIDEIQGVGLSLHGGPGLDTLRGPSGGASWNVTGLDVGTVDSHPFESIEQLFGATGAPDVFNVDIAGDLTGVISGGGGGSDKLTIHYAGPELLHSIGGYGPTNVQLGQLSHDYLGIESVAYVTPNATSHSVTLEGHSTVARLTQNDDGQLVVTYSYPFNDVTTADDEAESITGDAAEALGKSVASAGDVNNDGYEDLLLGAPDGDAAYLVFGGADGVGGVDLASLDGTDGVKLVGSAGSMAGASLSAAGDVNADGIADFIVGAPGLSGGYAALVFGREDGFDGEVDLESLDGTNGFRILGGTVGDQLGAAVTSLFDFNGDQIPDMLVGAPGEDTGGDGAGSAYVILGSDQGFAATFDVTTLDGTAGVAIHGLAAGDALGGAVAAGDIDADGAADAILGAAGANSGAGAVYAVVGRITALPAAIDLNGLQGVNGFVINGDSAGDALGSSLDVGDVDHDGIYDVLATAPGAAKAYALFGTQEDHLASYDLSMLDGSTGMIVDLGDNADGTGMAIASIGDINGDLVADFAVSSPQSTAGTGSGEVFVFYGDASNRSGVDTPTTIVVSDLDGSNGFALRADESGQRLGTAISGADLNGDGFDDLIAGSPAAANGAGTVFVLDGRSEGGDEYGVTFDLPTDSFSIGTDDDNSGATVYIGEDSSASTIDMNGAKLSVDLRHGVIYQTPRTSKVIVEANTTIDTTSADDDSGLIRLAATQVKVHDGASLLAQADGGEADDVRLLAENVVLDTPFVTDEIFEITNAFANNSRYLAEVDIDGGVTILGAKIEIDADAGNRNLQEYVGQGIVGLSTVMERELGVVGDIFASPVSVVVRNAKSVIDIGDGMNDVLIVGDEDVEIAGDSRVESQLPAVFWGFKSGLTSSGFAVAVSLIKSETFVHLYDGVTVMSGEDVSILSSTESVTAATARVSLGIGKSPIPGANDFPTDPNAKMAAALWATSAPTAHVMLDTGTSVYADGTVEIAAEGADDFNSEASTTAYKDGTAGIALSYSSSQADIKAVVNGTVTSAAEADADHTVDFNPFTDVDFAEDTIYLGDGHAYETGDKVYYDPGDGGAVEGLKPRTEYYVISVTVDDVADRIQLAASKDDAEAGMQIDLVAQPVLVTSDDRKIAIGAVDTVAELVRWSFDHGVFDGDALTYTAAPNKAIQGLTSGQTYYAIVGEDTESLGLAETVGGDAVDLETSIQFKVESTGQVLTVESVDGNNNLFTFTEDHGLSAGDAVDLTGAFDFPLISDDTGEPLADGTFYAVTVYDENGNAVANQIRLATSAADAQQENTYDGLVEFTVGSDDVTGSEHVLSDLSGDGVSITASLENAHEIAAKSLIGKSIGILESMSKGELSSEFTAQTVGALWGWVQDLALGPSQNLEAPGNANVNASESTFNLAASGAVYTIESTVLAIVGSTAEIYSNSNTVVDAKVAQLLTTEAEGALTRGKKQDAPTFAMGGAGLVGWTDHTVRAIVNDGASIDSRGKLRVDASTSYPFRAPIQDPEKFGKYLFDNLKSDLGEVVSLTSSRVPVLQEAAFNHWVRTVSALEDPEVSAAVMVDVHWREGDTRAIIAEGAQINQDAAYRTDAQAVDVKARTQMNLVSAGGVFEVRANAVGIKNAVQRSSAAAIYNPVASEAEKGGIGTGVDWSTVNITTKAGIGLLSPVDDSGKKIDDPASSGNTTRVHTGAPGLTVDADEDLFYLQYMQTGASVSGQDGFVFDGGAAIKDHTSHTTAAITGGTIVTGGSVDVDSTSEVNAVAINGDIASGGAVGVGGAVTIWSLDRTTKAYIGADNTSGATDDPRDPADFTGLNADADLSVDAYDTGGVYLQALAAEVSSAAQREQAEPMDYEDESEDSLDESDNRSIIANFGVDDEEEEANGPEASPAFGLSVSADVSLVDLSDKVYAFIDDAGEFSANNVTVTAKNDISGWAVTGALAVAQNPDVTTSNALAGSYAEMRLRDNITTAYVNAATIVAAGGLTVDARRLGNITAASASGADDTRNNLNQATGVSLAGSAAIVKVRQTVDAHVSDADLTVGADSSIVAKDDLSVVTIAGGMDIGGRLGFGGGVAYTTIDAHATATVDDSTIVQSAGGLGIDATMGSTNKSRVIGGAATWGASPTGAVADATVVVTEVNINGDYPAVIASITGSRYTNTSTDTTPGSGELSITSADETSYEAAAGAVTVDGRAALGFAYAENHVHQKVRAIVDDTVVDSTTAGGLTVDAKSKVGGQGYALGTVGNADAVSVAGSTVVNLIKRDSEAVIRNGSDVEIAGDLSLGSALATAGSPNAGVIIAVAGAFGDITGQAAGAGGAAIVDNEVTDTILATIEDSVVTASGDASVTATNGTGQIVGGTVGLERAEQFAAGGSVVTNDVNATTTAGVVNVSTLTADGDVSIAASEDGAKLVANAGQLVTASGASGGSGVSVGAAIATNTGKSQVTAQVVESDVASTGGAASVDAERHNALLLTLAVGGDLAGSFAGSGSAATNDYTHNTYAEVTEFSTLTGTDDVSITAGENGVSLGAAAGTVSKGKVGIGIGEATNNLVNNIRASLGGRDVTDMSNDHTSATSTGAAVNIEAKKTDTVNVVVAVGGEGAETAAVGGSVAVHDTTRTVDAHAAGATATGTDVNIVADLHGSTTVVVAGNLDIGLAGQLGTGDPNVSENNNEVPESQVEAKPEIVDPVQNVNDEPELLGPPMQTEDVLANLDLEESLSYSSDEASGIDSDPEIDDSQQPNESAVEPAVDAPAASEASIAVGAAVAFNYTDNTVLAASGGANLTATSGDVVIDANLAEFNIAASGAGTSAGKSSVTGAAAGAINDVRHTVDAYIDAANENGARVEADGSVQVNADSLAHLYTIAGNASFTTDSLSLGVSIADLSHTDHTRAYIDNATVVGNGGQPGVSVETADGDDKTTDDDFTGVSVVATSREVVTNIAAGIEDSGTSGSAGVDIANSSSIVTLDETTTARIKPGATVLGSEDFENAAHINVFAYDETQTLGAGGAIGVSGADTFGFGLSIDSGNITKNTIAQAGGASVGANGNLTVQALSKEKVTSYTGTLEASKGEVVAATAGLQLLDLTTEAYIDGEDGANTDATVYGNILVAAHDHTRLDQFAGSVDASGGGKFNVGATLGYSHVRKQTEAYIGENVNSVYAQSLSDFELVTALADGFDIDYEAPDGDGTEVQAPDLTLADNTGAGGEPITDPTLTTNRVATARRRSVEGIAVSATNADIIKSQAYSAGVSNASAFNGSGSARTGTNIARAHIDGGEITAAPFGNSNQLIGEVLVTASQDYHRLGVAGALTVSGEAAGTPAMGWTAIDLETTSEIGDDVSVRAGRDVQVIADTTSHFTGIDVGLDAALGNAALDGSAGVVDLTGTTLARIGAGADVDANGSVLVAAQDDTTVTSIAGGLAIDLLPLESGAVAASFNYVNLVKNTDAIIDAGASVTGRGQTGATVTALTGESPSSGDLTEKSVAGVSVMALSSETLSNDAISGVLAGGGGVSGAAMFTHVHSDTTATIADDAAINYHNNDDASDDQGVYVTAGNDVKATHIAGGVAVGLGVLGGAVDVGIVRNDTIATIGNDAIVRAVGDLGVHAVTRRNVKTTDVSSADGVGGVAGSVAVWTLGRKFDSTYDTVDTSGVDALKQLAGAGGQSSAFGSFGDYADARADRDDVADSLGGYQADPDATGGQINGRDVTPGSQTIASLGDAASANVSAAVDGLSGNASDTMVLDDESNTSAQILTSPTAGTGVEVGGDVSVTSADRIELDMITGAVDVDVIGIGAGVGVAKLRGGGDAHIDGRITAGGDVVVDSASEHHLNDEALAGEAGVIDLAAAVADIEDYTEQQAALATGAEIVAADSVSVTASTNYTKFEASSGDLGVGAVAAGASVAQAKSLGAVRAFADDAAIGSAASPIAGNVTIAATFTPDSHPKATANAISVGIGAGDGTRADAVFRPQVEAWFGAGTSAANIMANGSVDILATVAAQPSAEALGLSVGAVLTIGVSQAESIASADVIAYVADNATITLPGTEANLKVYATSGTDETPDDPFAHARASGGGALSGLGTDAKATIKPTVKSYIGKGANVTVTESVLVEAAESWVGFAHASGGDYGGLAIGENDATLDVQPEVTAYINADEINAPGVSVQALSGEAGSLSYFTFDSANVDYSANTIQFDAPHGLQDGDQIVYTANDTPIGGLSDGGTYTVKVKDERTVQFVVEIETGDVDSLGNDYVSSTGPHGLETTAGVIYETNGGDAIGGLTNGHTYYVRAVDPHTLKFATSPEIADNLYMTDVVVPSGNAGSDYAEVGYLASTVSGSAFVGQASSGDRYIHNFTSAPNWSDGDFVVYFAQDDQTIGALTLGGGYYVRQSTDHAGRWHFYTTEADYQSDINDKNESARIKFNDNHTGRFAVYTESDWYVNSSSTRSPDTFFQAGAVDGTNDQITFAGSVPIATGDVVSITPQNHMIDFGAPFGLYYYAHVTHSGGNTIVKLALSQADLSSGTYLDLITDDLSLGENYTLGRPFQIKTGDVLNYNGPLDLRFSASNINADGTITIDTSDATELLNDLISLQASGGKLVYDVASTYADTTPLSQLTIGHEYGFSIPNESADSLTIKLNGITLNSTEDTSGGAPTQHVLRLGSDHTPIDGLVTGKDYYLIVDGSTPGQFRFADTAADASSGKHIDLYSTANIKIGSTTHEITAVDYDNNAVTVANASSISTGQQLTYHAAWNKWIIGVSGGATYYAIKNANGTISFADSAADASSGVARNLAAVARLNDTSNTVHGVTVNADNDTLTLTNASELLETGDAVTYQGIFGQFLVGVERGPTYYVVRADPDDPAVLRLAETYEEAINSDGRSGTIRFYEASSTQTRSIGTQFIGLNAIDITEPTTPSSQYLVVDLTDQSSSGQQSFSPPQAEPDSDKPATPTVQGSASNGSLIGGFGASATANIKPVVYAFVGSPDGVDTSSSAIINAEDLYVATESNVDVTAHAFDYGVGVLVGLGDAQVDVTVVNTATTYVGAGATSTLTRDATLKSTTSETIDAQTSIKGGGGIADIENSKSTVNIGREATVTVGDDATIDADGKITLTAESDVSGNSTAKAHANGTYTLPTPKSLVSIGTGDAADAQTAIFINDASLSADTFDIDADVTYGRFDSYATDHSHDVFSNDSANAQLLIDEDARVSINSGAALSADNQSAIDAVLAWDYLTAISEVHTKALAEDAHAKADLTLSGGAGLYGSLADPNSLFTSNASVTGSTSGDHFKEHHKVVSSWLWIKSKKHSGGSPTDNSSTTNDLAQAPAATIPLAGDGLIFVSPDMFPLSSAGNRRVNGAPTSDRAFPTYGRAGGPPVSSAAAQDFDTVTDAAIREMFQPRSFAGRRPSFSPIRASFGQFDMDDLMNIDQPGEVNVADLVFGDSDFDS